MTLFNQNRHDDPIIKNAQPDIGVSTTNRIIKNAAVTESIIARAERIARPLRSHFKTPLSLKIVKRRLCCSPILKEKLGYSASVRTNPNRLKLKPFKFGINSLKTINIAAITIGNNMVILISILSTK
jgi:hypothetical protein